MIYWYKFVKHRLSPCLETLKGAQSECLSQLHVTNIYKKIKSILFSCERRKLNFLKTLLWIWSYLGSNYKSNIHTAWDHNYTRSPGSIAGCYTAVVWTKILEKNSEFMILRFLLLDKLLLVMDKAVLELCSLFWEST